MTRPVVLVHGYSDRGSSFDEWQRLLEQRGFDIRKPCQYKSLTNEVTIKDLGEAFDRAIKCDPDLRSEDSEFDAIVHSTGMLVLRAWLTNTSHRKNRLKHIVGLAPATFGSPLAHKGRSVLGSIFKGNREFGPDFLEAGDLILDGLELGSSFLWELSHRDLFGAHPFYGPGTETPFVFTFCGDRAYGGLRRVVNAPGTDGTVRFAGCALRSRKITVELNHARATDTIDRMVFRDWVPGSAKTVFVPGKNHGTIMSNPGQELADVVAEALRTGDDGQITFEEWKTRHEGKGQPKTPYQQFVVRALDERGDPILDYDLEAFTRDAHGRESVIPVFDEAPHAYARDKSLRCFQANVAEAMTKANLFLRVSASSGTKLVGYRGHGTHAPGEFSDGITNVVIDMTGRLQPGDAKAFFEPFTTTFVEIILDREPHPFEDDARSQVLQFLPWA